MSTNELRREMVERQLLRRGISDGLVLEAFQIVPRDDFVPAGLRARSSNMVKYVAVWLDHKEARVCHIHPERIDETTVSAPLHSIHHKHPGSTERDKAHPDDAKRFFAEVGQALEDAEQVLVVGPSTAKLSFLRHVHSHQPALEQRIVGIETVDHPTDGQLVAYAKKYFGVRDRAR